jgi:hypothetical protein
MKDPFLKFKYCIGLGDIIRCVLHFKYINFFTEKIFKKQKNCQTCINRAYALNLLFPIPFWKFWFSSFEKMQETLIKDCELYGYKVVKQDSSNETKTENVSQKINEKKINNNFLTYENYVFLKKTESNVENLKLVNFIFKKIDK